MFTIEPAAQDRFRDLLCLLLDDKAFAFVHGRQRQAHIDEMKSTLFDSGNFGMSLRPRKAPKGKRSGHKARRPKRSTTGPLLKQPIAELVSVVHCELCGHSVDARRMHPHMVRYHGAAFSSKQQA